MNANGDIVGYNMYAYCSNNPIMYVDPTGEAILTALIVGVIVGAVIGGTIGGTVAYNSAKSSGLEGTDLLRATVGGVAKGAVIGGIAVGLIGATGGSIAAYGWGANLSSAMITGTATMLARATEVAFLQGRKSLNDGKNGWQTANDVVNSVFANGGNIIGTTPIMKSAGLAFSHALNVSVSKIFDETPSLSSTLGATGGKFSYIFAAWAWIDAGISIFSKDPVMRANERGYTLQ